MQLLKRNGNSFVPVKQVKSVQEAIDWINFGGSTTDIYTVVDDSTKQFRVVSGHHYDGSWQHQTY